MSLKNAQIIPPILGFNHSLISNLVNPGDWVVDATMGNGFDTLFLAELVGKSGKVLAFDIQQQAIDSTRQKLAEAHCLEAVELILDSHHHLSTYLPEGKTIQAAMMNLGYLPHGNHDITTKVETTLKAIEIILEKLNVPGILTIVIYPGHDEGQSESDRLDLWVSTLSPHHYTALQYRLKNTRKASPWLLAIEKLKF